MNNSIKCVSCNFENPFYKSVCKNCGAYLRDKVYNIDLWKILGLLIESPKDAFRIIIFSEHKNFIYLILFFAAIKFYVDANFISVLFKTYHPFEINLFLEFGIILIIVLLIIYLLSLLLTTIENRFGLQAREKDNFAITIYSLVPHAFAAILIFPIELILFGEYLFSTNPSPFALKEILAYIMLVFESLIIIYSIVLLAAANFVMTKNLIFSVLISLGINILIFYSLYLSTKLFI